MEAKDNAQRILALYAVISANGEKGTDSSVTANEGAMISLFASNLSTYQGIEGVKIRRRKPILRIPKINVFSFKDDGTVDHYAISNVRAESIEGEEIDFKNPIILN